LSELAIPHFITSTIFAASQNNRQQFLSNARFLCFMAVSFGVFSGLRGVCFAVANQQLILRMRTSLYKTVITQVRPSAE
jgi:hypothetical protein